MGNIMSNQTKYLKDYSEPSHWIRTIHLTIELNIPKTIVTSVLSIEPNIKQSSSFLELQGESLELLSVALDGKLLEPSEYQQDEKSLTLRSVPQKPFELIIQTFIEPDKNTALSGLYYTGGNYCTQCEPEGFRRITYYLDRPDVLALFTTTIIANKEKFRIYSQMVT